MSTATFVEPAVELTVVSSPEAMETDDALYEIVYGRMVEVPAMSVRAVMIATRMTSAINGFAGPKGLGEAFTELLIHLPLPEDESRDRRPDVSFFYYRQSLKNADDDPDARAWVAVPDLEVEVISPTDRAEAQREKVIEYFRAGVRSVWVVYPNLRLVDVYDTPTTLRVFGPDETLTGEPVLPGFQLSLAELFTPFGAPKA